MSKEVEVQFKECYSGYYELKYRYKNIFSTWKKLRLICYIDDFYGLTYKPTIVSTKNMDEIMNLLHKRVKECNNSFTEFLNENKRLKKEWDDQWSRYTKLNC